MATKQRGRRRKARPTRKQEVARLEALQGQERLNELIKLFYGKRRRVLHDRDYRRLAHPGEAVLKSLYDACCSQDPFSWPTGARRSVAGEWTCIVEGLVKYVSTEGMGPEDFADSLEGSLSPRRAKALRAGSPPTKAEIRAYQLSLSTDAEALISEEGCDFEVVSFGTRDPSGRRMWFALYPSEGFDWSTMWKGPFRTRRTLWPWRSCEYATTEWGHGNSTLEDRSTDEELLDMEKNAAEREPPPYVAGWEFLGTATVVGMWSEDEVSFRCGRTEGGYRLDVIGGVFKTITAPAADLPTERPCEALLRRAVRGLLQWHGRLEVPDPGDPRQDALRSLVEDVEAEMEANKAEAAKWSTAPIVVTAGDLGLSPEPDVMGASYFNARCPDTNHTLLLHAERGEYWCGYCNASGDLDGLKAFVATRREGSLR